MKPLLSVVADSAEASGWVQTWRLAGLVNYISANVMRLGFNLFAGKSVPVLALNFFVIIGSG